MNWPSELKIKNKQPLKKLTTFKVGGVARFFSEVRSVKQLKLLLIEARRKKIPVRIIGAGSNLLISDNGLDCLVIKLGKPFFKNVSVKGNLISAGSAVMLSTLVKTSLENSLQGLEFLVGLPGSLGGALVMNAGCWGLSIGNLVKEVEIMDYDGNINTLNRNEINFTYRKSSLNRCVILRATLVFKNCAKGLIKRNMNKYIINRRANQDLRYPSAGCIFKNPQNDSAGRLIDLCGLKGEALGAAFISNRHANFILNKGNAKAEDILQLMKIIKRRVRDKFKVNLQPEIKIWK